jgi:alpha-1,3-rhamnosyl/mannosyltransferase
VSEEKLGRLYRGAMLFVAPSLYEGFGMPLLEAMAHGVPVACSDLDVFREVGADAVETFDPRTTASMVETLRYLLADSGRRCELARAGRSRVGCFSWNASAGKVLDLYDWLGCRSR